jgi:CRP-like cAMP-binding protein
MTRLSGKSDFQSFYQHLSPEDRDTIDKAGEKKWAQAGDFLMQQEEPSDAVFILEEGVVEVFIDTPGVKRNAPLAYLGRGDILGELGVLNQCRRSATIRAVNDVHYRSLEKESFLDLMESLPGFGLYMSYLLSERLALTTSNMVYNSFCVDLSGKLPNFDLLAVFHTIETSRCSGELKLIGRGKEVLGSIYIIDSKVRQAAFLHLRGLEALKQLLLEPDLEGAFSFRRQDVLPKSFEPESRLDISLTALLLETAIERDEMESLPSGFKTLTGSISPAPQWEAGKDQLEGTALQISQLVERGPETLRSIWSRCNLSSLTLARICQKMCETGLLTYQP